MADILDDPEEEEERDHIDAEEDGQAPAHRVTWTDDEDSDDVYNKFKNRKRRAQRPAKSKSTRVSASGAVPAKDGEARHKRRRIEQPSRAARRDTRDESDGEDPFMPRYLRERKQKFETDHERLQASGLRLPPSYEEVEFSDDERLAHLKERPAFTQTKPMQAYRDRELPQSLGIIPAPVAQWLRDYQLEGVAFLHRLFVYQTGGILGDDMGLGKTVQVIAFLTAAFGKTGDERDRKRMRKMRRARADWYPRVLIVCPGTLIENWKAELDRWGWWHVDVFHGNTKEEALQTATAGRLEILITTYSTYRNFKSALNCVNWDCVVADECHQVKGQNSETTKAMNEINSLCRIGLTGTAIQNSYEELWVLLNWAVPGRFGPMSEWKRTISEPLRMGQSHEATLHQLGKARKVAKALVDNLLPPFFLRRMKSLIADQLPKKNDRVIFCPLTETQHQAYITFVNSDVVQYIKHASEVCDCLSGKKKGWCCYQLLPGGEGWQAYVFSAVNILQKLSNHLAVLIPQGTDPVEKQQRDLTLLKAALPNEWQNLYATRGSILHYSNPAYCGKWKVLKKLLKFWHDAGDKVLVFSHSVRLLRMLRQLFQHTAYNVAYLDGSMTYAARAEAVAEYNADPAQFVFLISTRAGGVGLNITAANKVVVVDPHWNPAWDLQAQDRAYRLGQVRDVDVFRLVSAGTIEEIVYARQVYKQQQANIGYTASTERRYFAGVQNSGAHKGEIFGMDNLFATPLVSGVSSVLEAIVHKTNVAEARAGVSVVDFDVDSTQDASLPASLPSEESLAGFDSDEPLLAASDSDPALAMLQDLIAEDPDSATTKSKSKTAPTRVSAARSDPVQAILAGAGVAYSHVNSEVVGPSRVEAQLSRQAEAAGNVVGEGDTRLFQASDPIGPDEEGESGEEIQDHHARLRVASDNSRSCSRGAGSSLANFRWRYRPPAAVRRRQFCSMAQTWGYSSATAFALDVEQWTSAQRRAALDKFYARRRRELEAEEDQHEEKMRMQSGTTIADEDDATQNLKASEVAESLANDDGECGDQKEQEEHETSEEWTF